MDFAIQKKIMEPILKDPKNSNCADCGSVSPTWASLDFGVFLCSNCSGAHRGLGPTITRVRSANLDKWQSEWFGNMQIGNTQLNFYWEADPSSKERKPHASSDLSEIARYVFEKYIKRKFVKDRQLQDPLTLFKQGKFTPYKSETKQQQPQKPVKLTQPIKKTESIKKNNVCLLDLDFQTTPSAPEVLQNVQSSPDPAIKKEINLFDVEEENTEVAQAGSTKSDDDRKKEEDLISFDTLIAQQEKPQPQPPQQSQLYNHWNYDGLKGQNMQLHHPYNAHIGNHNLVYQQQYQVNHAQRGPHHFSMPHGFHAPTVPQQQPTFW